MADDEKNEIEETEAVEPAAEPPVRDSGPGDGVSGEPGGSPGEARSDEAIAEPAPATDEAVSEPAADEAVAEPAGGAETSEAATQNPPREKKAKSRRHVPRSERRQRSKPTREKPAERKPIVRGERAEIERGRRQERRGVVVSDKGDKTIVVKVDVIKLHPKYKKVVRRAVKFHAHDERNEAGAGDVVRIVETRPLSKTKHWRLAEIVEKAR
jgi:small subunit ribosomal protein S17